MTVSVEKDLSLKVYLIVLFIIISGCTRYSAPENNLKFSNLDSAGQLEGIFKNEGDPRGYLSKYVFRDSKPKNITHYDIDLIQVIFSENTLFVNAIMTDCIIYAEKYVYGTDFDFVNGKIVINSDIDILTRGKGDPIVGPSYEEFVIGLDSKGHGKTKSSMTIAGLVYLVFPVVFRDVSESRFLRIEEYKKYELCGTS